MCFICPCLLIALVLVIFYFYKRENFYSPEYGGDEGISLMPDAYAGLYGGERWWQSRAWWVPNMSSTQCARACRGDCEKKCNIGCNAQTF